MKTCYKEVSVSCSPLATWSGIKFMLRKGWFVDQSLQDRFRPTWIDWIWGILLYSVRKTVKLQCYDPFEYELPIEDHVVSSMIQWQWAQHGSITELIYSMHRVKEVGEFLVAMGTKSTQRMGAEGFSCYPCITRTERGLELREIASFELTNLLKNHRGKIWFLERIP